MRGTEPQVVRDDQDAPAPPTSAPPPGARSRRTASALLVGLALLSLAAPQLASEEPLVDLRLGSLRIAIPAPVPWSERTVRLDESLRPPSLRHLCGTDLLGRDVLARLLHGARASLLIGFGATLGALLLGLLLGGTAALRQGPVDLILGRVIEILGCFPPLLLALCLVAAWGQRGLIPMIVGIAAGRTAAAARFARSETIRLQGASFWLAARATGAGPWQAARRHLLPLLATPLLVQAAFGIAQAVLLESTLGFLGLGVEPPTPSWGQMIGEGRGMAGAAWWTIAFPAAALALTLALLLQGGRESVVNEGRS